jgi:type IX secretion system PorP/SprF family membrane protein
MKSGWFLASFLFAGVAVSAQEFSVTNTNQSLLSLNPSFAGSNGFIRNQLSIGSQWTKRSQVAGFYNNTFDMYLKPIKAGIAVAGQVANFYQGTIRDYAVGVTYAQYFAFSDGKNKLVPSVQAFYRHLSLDYTALHLDDFKHSPPNGSGEKCNYLDLNAGFLYSHADRLFVGGSIYHLNSPVPDIALKYKISPLYSINGSYNFLLGESSLLQVMYVYTKQESSYNSRLGANLLLAKHLLLGAGYGSRDILYSNIGCRDSTYAISIGYAVSLSGFSKQTYSGWEVHFSYNLRSKGRRSELISFESM